MFNSWASVRSASITVGFISAIVCGYLLAQLLILEWPSAADSWSIKISVYLAAAFLVLALAGNTWLWMSSVLDNRVGQSSRSGS